MRWRTHLMQDAVHSVPHQKLVLERLDVNIGSPHLQGVPNYEVHELDDRRLVRHVDAVLVFPDVADDLEVVLGKVLDDFFNGLGVAAVAAFDRFLDLFRGRLDDLEFGRDDALQLVQRLDVVGIRHGDLGNAGPRLADGNKLMLLQKGVGQLVKKLLVYFGCRQVEAFLTHLFVL